MLAFAGVLALAAAWLLATEAARSTILARLVDHPPATPSDCRAASAAFVRGDLWAECAEAYDAASAVDDSAEMARDADERAAAWTPFRTQVWLRLASAEARLDWLNRRAVEALRMSFYTGPNEIDLIPRRLLATAQPDMLADADIRRLASHDIQTVLTYAPNVKPAIVAAYRHASPEGRTFLETAVAEVDAAFVRELQSDQPSHK
jgi:hypothetical protein